MKRLRLAALLPLLLLAGCGHSLPRLQTTRLVGSAADLARFEGVWHDASGEIVTTVSSRWEPRLGFWLPPTFKLTSAHLRDGELVLCIESAEGQYSISVRPTSETRALMAVRSARTLAPECCLCGNLAYDTTLVRETSSTWLARRSARQTAELARKAVHQARESTFDLLARLL